MFVGPSSICFKLCSHSACPQTQHFRRTIQFLPDADHEIFFIPTFQLFPFNLCRTLLSATNVTELNVTSQWPPADNCQLFMTRVNGRETDDVKKMTDDFVADVSRCAVDCHNEPDLHMVIRSRDKALAVHAVFHTLLLAICVNRSCCARMPAHIAQMAGRETRR